MLGTTTGGIIGAYLKIKSSKILSFILEFTAGLTNELNLVYRYLRCSSPYKRV